MSARIPTGVELTCLDPVFREDPYPIFDLLRTYDPVHHDTQLGRYVITRHDDVLRVLRDPDLWSDPRKGNEGGFARGFLMRGDGDPPMLMMDNPDHRRLRSLVSQAFTPRAVESWRDHARSVVGRIVEAVPASDNAEFEFMEAIANPIPTMVIAEILGIDAENYSKLREWSDDIMKVAFSPLPTSQDAALAERSRESLYALFGEEIDERRRRGGVDLISALVRAEESGEKLADSEITQQCELLLLAGNLTTSDLLGNAMMALVRNPEQLEKLRENPQLIANSIEESLRYDTSVTDTGRIANRDFEIRGVKIARGESITLCLAAANRDPEVYADPNRFDIERVDVHHQSFGGGRHFCLGAHLARIELAEAITAIIKRFQSLSPGDRGHSYASNPSFRGLDEFWLATR